MAWVWVRNLPGFLGLGWKKVWVSLGSVVWVSGFSSLGFWVGGFWVSGLVFLGSGFSRRVGKRVSRVGKKALWVGKISLGWGWGWNFTSLGLLRVPLG